MGNKGSSLEFGVHEMRGKRPTMEDRTIAMCDGQDEALLAVFDGHNGSECSNYLGIHYPEILKSQPTFEEGPYGDVGAALRSAALQIDDQFLKEAKSNGWKAGSTAVIAYWRNSGLWISNTGDSRAIAIINRECFPLSVDHKPDNPDEKKRIEAHGGKVMMGRIMGMLAVSRAFGDLHFKDYNFITAEPSISYTLVTDKLQYLVLACDGLWDVISNEAVAQYVVACEGFTCKEIAKSLAQEAIEKGSKDNISIVVAKFKMKYSNPAPKTLADSSIFGAVTQHPSMSASGQNIHQNNT